MTNAEKNQVIAQHFILFSSSFTKQLYYGNSMQAIFLRVQQEAV